MKILYVPETLNLEGKVPPDVEQYYYVITTLLYKLPPDDEKKGWTRLNMEALRDWIPKDRLKGIMTYLIENRIIRQHTHFKVGEHSRRYRIAPPYCNQPLRRVVATGKVARKLTIGERKRIRIPHRKPYRWLYKWLTRVEFDYDAALAYCQTLPNIQANPVRVTADSIHNRKWTFIVDPFGHRLHTNLTRLPTEMRPLLTIGGKKLVNIDIACSQPYFLLLLLDGKSKEQEIIEQNQTILNQNQNLSPNHLPWYSGEYAQSVCNGTVYERLMSHTGELDRKLAKEAFFFAMFCETHKWRYKKEEQFEQAFPVEYAACRRIKSNNYKDLAKFLQRSESSFMLDGVCREIMEECPECPTATIHDSVLTTEDYADYVAGKMLTRAAPHGFTPTVKIERY